MLRGTLLLRDIDGGGLRGETLLLRTLFGTVKRVVIIYYVVNFAHWFEVLHLVTKQVV